MTPAARFRALLWFILSAVYFFLAQEMAIHAARGLAAGDWLQLASRSTLLFMLLFGYAGMGYIGQGQREPIKAMGLVRRPDWGREFALGSAIGWAGMVACVLPIALTGGLIVTFFTAQRQFALVVLDLVVLAIAGLAEEIAFRGYPFQRLIEATSPTAATIFMSLFFGAIHLANPGATFASTIVTIFAGWLLAICYLRTRALWLSWGFHFTWNATMGVLFGLPISGITTFSPVVASNAMGPLWLTGGDYGPEGSAVCAIVILVLIFVTIRATRDLHHRYAQPVIVAAGIPVDIDAISRRQHEQAMGPQVPAAPQIVQISGVQNPNSREETPSQPSLDGDQLASVPKETPPQES